MPVVNREKEYQIVERARERGWTDEQIKQAILVFRQNEGSIGVGDELKKGASNLGGQLAKRGSAIAQSFKQSYKGEIHPLEASLQTVGNIVGGIGDVLGEAVMTGVEALTPEDTENAIIEKTKAILRTTVGKAAVQALSGGIEKYQSWKQTNPRLAKDLESVLNIASLFPISKIARSTVKGASAIAGGTAKVVEDVGNMAGGAIKSVAESQSASGLSRGVASIAERLPRAIKRGRESVSDFAQQAKRMETASPAVQQAIKAQLDDKIINTIQSADSQTLNSYKKMVDIAEDVGEKIGVKKRPSIIAGEAAADQYDLIYRQKRNVGEQIGDAVKKLQKDVVLSLDTVGTQIDDIFESIGVKNITDKGKLVFGSSSNLTNAERKKVQELYDLVLEGMENPTPYNIYKRDQLFSKLQREARMEQIGEIIIDMPDGTRKSIFSAFRDIFSKTLDDVSPEIKFLNNEYRNISQVIDDIEDSIFKAPDFNITKISDPADFAKTNLRRLLQDAQSSGAYADIAEQMDSLARQLGYEGARPYDLIAFAEELRKLFPDTIPQASFQGSIRTSLAGLAEKALDVGKINIKDQQRALKMLLEELLK